MKNLDQIIKDELTLLKADLKTGDEIESQFSPGGKEIRTSKKVGEARIKFMHTIRDLLTSNEITTQEATQATQLFGKKTKSIYWL